ncbi:dihydroxyacetone kinase subunit DhaK [Sphaerochaeta halotolerans]|uniref:dihydroxyacetone kinase subunit DhaK n=1 Tax=Sphaerochaeta halotolerans TaxID=2293840 RepID=UPI00136EAF6C|nr:dihydroxyacetone kinase subunit DhaK [Sphaerochaeta halotolerans]MXI86984.1 dihydroxyacetone kinase subunit DhaK [Sphaerochaeta halotolerans]
MKKFINNPEAFVEEMLEGVMAAHADQLAYVDDDIKCVLRADRSKRKVALASGGGSGHLPLFMGYVGEGMLDGCTVGGVFQSPSANQMYEVTKAIDQGMGVLYIYGNYSGDVINFDMATELADLDDIRVETVLGADDIASAPKEEKDKRRGVAGIFYLYKCAGAAAELGWDLDEVKRVAKKTGERVATIGVALSPCIIPEVGKPSFTIGEDEMEIGMGIHGEPGIRRGKLQKADVVVDEILPAILNDVEVVTGDEVSILINGLGATPKEELYIIYRRIAQVLNEKGVKMVKLYCGEYATSMEMAGFSISVCKLDDELKSLLSEKAYTPFFEQIKLEL